MALREVSDEEFDVLIAAYQHRRASDATSLAHLAQKVSMLDLDPPIPCAKSDAPGVVSPSEARLGWVGYIPEADIVKQLLCLAHQSGQSDESLVMMSDAEWDDFVVRAFRVGAAIRLAVLRQV